jgi:hypothetical protein
LAIEAGYAEESERQRRAFGALFFADDDMLATETAQSGSVGVPSSESIANESTKPSTREPEILEASVDLSIDRYPALALGGEDADEGPDVEATQRKAIEDTDSERGDHVLDEDIGPNDEDYADDQNDAPDFGYEAIDLD